MKKLKVAILGSGNIGTDLLVKSLRSPFLECTLFIGRNLSSPGIAKALSLGVNVSDKSIHAIIKNPEACDLVFDATTANDHRKHWAVLEKLEKTVIDMTPAKIGKMCVPAVNLQECLKYQNINMISCGGQTSIPMAYTIGQHMKGVEYIEVVSSIASRSAGPGTRANLDEYIETTEMGIQLFSNCKKAKTILNLNPAQPCVDMQTTIYAKVNSEFEISTLIAPIQDMVERIQKYVPGYQLIIPPTINAGRVVIMVKVQGVGDYLPKYAGNLDIINCAAIATAEEFAKQRGKLA